MNRCTLTLPPSKENGPEGGTAKAGLRRPGIQSRGWPGLGVSAPGSRGHLRSSLTIPSLRTPPPSSPPTPFLRPISATHQPVREVSRRLQPGSPTLGGVTFCRSGTRGRGQGEGRQPEGMKDEAPAKKVGGGGGGCHSRSPAHSAAITVPEAASPAGRRHPPRRHGGAPRSPGARAPDAHLPLRGDTEKPGRDRGEGKRGEEQSTSWLLDP